MRFAVDPYYNTENSANRLWYELFHDFKFASNSVTSTPLLIVCIKYNLPYDVTSGSDIIPYNKSDKTLLLTHLVTLRNNVNYNAP